jgi:hypothetical protein
MVSVAILIFNHVQRPMVELVSASFVTDGLSIMYLAKAIASTVLKCTMRSSEEVDTSVQGHWWTRPLAKKSPSWLRITRIFLIILFLVIGALLVVSAVFMTTLLKGQPSSVSNLPAIQNATRVAGFCILFVALVASGAASVALLVGSGKTKVLPVLDDPSRFSLYWISPLTLPASIITGSTVANVDLSLPEYVALRVVMELIVVFGAAIHAIRLHPKIRAEERMMENTYWNEQQAKDPEGWAKAEAELVPVLARALRDEPEPSPSVQDVSMDEYFRNACIDAEKFVYITDKHGVLPQSLDHGVDLGAYITRNPISQPRYRHATYKEPRLLEETLLPRLQASRSRESRIAAIYQYYMSKQFPANGQDAERDRWVRIALAIRSSLPERNGCVDWPYNTGLV